MTNPAETIIRSFVDALARLAHNPNAVREAGGIAPLVTLLRSCTSEVQALTAAVLRDLAAESPDNRVAILKAGGLHELVEMVRQDASSTASGEAAGALRSLSNDFPAGCSAIVEARGVDALVAMVAAGRPGSTSAIQSTGVLANLAHADEGHCAAILQAGGVQQLVGLLRRVHSASNVGTRRLPTDVKERLEKTAEEAANALFRLASGAPSCNAAIRLANALGPLIDTLLCSGIESASAQSAANAVVELVRSDDESKMAALTALAKAAMDETFDGHGWSLSFPTLRHILHAAAERLLLQEADGPSATAMQMAIDVGRAVELPARRLDEARAAFDEAQAHRKREKLSEQAEARRRAKEDELIQRAADRRDDELKASSSASDTQQHQLQHGAKQRRKERDATSLPGAEASRTAPMVAPLRSAKAGPSSGQASQRGSKSDARKAISQTARSGAENVKARRQTSVKRAAGPKASKGEWGADRSEVSLQFIPRAQLLEKIERIAVLNSEAATMPKELAVTVDERDRWHSRWDSKFHSMLTTGFAQGFASGHRPLSGKDHEPARGEPPLRQSQHDKGRDSAQGHWQTVREAVRAVARAQRPML